MRQNNDIASVAADLQVILTNELGNTIKKSVLFYIDGRGDKDEISSSEREMIAEKAWVKVVENKACFRATGQAKFITWAKKVAINQASDELAKLKHDALHRTSSLYGEQREENSDCRTDEAKPVCYKSFGSTADCDSSLYWKDAVVTLKKIVSSYSGRDRIVAQMLIAERTKTEIMAETQMTGGNVDTCICRVRKRMRSDLRDAGYDLVA